MEEGVCSGDYLMVVKNNYFWLGEETEAGFLANGEIVKVKKIIKREEMYGFHFARAIIELIDYPKMDEIEVVINLDALESEGPSLTREQMKLLFFAVEKEYLHIKNKRERYEKILNNQYFAAVQVKFAYAVTCHKSQGGQWSAVFIDHGYLPDGANNRDFHRWLYTAITRATKKVYLVNFDQRFFGS
jgi:ATP-dependent exoDNAse (exonuclease V) alpha subunit